MAPFKLEVFRITIDTCLLSDDANYRVNTVSSMFRSFIVLCSLIFFHSSARVLARVESHFAERCVDCGEALRYTRPRSRETLEAPITRKTQSYIFSNNNTVIYSLRPFEETIKGLCLMLFLINNLY